MSARTTPELQARMRNLRRSGWACEQIGLVLGVGASTVRRHTRDIVPDPVQDPVQDSAPVPAAPKRAGPGARVDAATKAHMRALRADGWSIRDIGRDTGYGWETVYRHCGDIPAPPGRRKGGRPIGDKKRAEILMLHDQGLSQLHIALAVDCAPSTVNRVVSESAARAGAGRGKPRVPSPPGGRVAAGGARYRACLMCQRDFKSEGAHNRICGGCKGTEAWKDGCGDFAVATG